MSRDNQVEIRIPDRGSEKATLYVTREAVQIDKRGQRIELTHDELVQISGLAAIFRPEPQR